MKVTYWHDGSKSTAYLDDEPLADMSYVGTDKHSEYPVHVKWSDSAELWYLVCDRKFEPEPPLYETLREVGERPACICAGTSSVSAS